MADAEAKAHDDHDSPEHIRKSIPMYFAVGATLLVLTFFTVWVAGLEVGRAAAIYIAIAIACTKGAMVVAWFMHLIDEKKIIYATLILTAFMFFVMLFVPLFTEGGNVGDPSQMIEAGAAGHNGAHGEH